MIVPPSEQNFSHATPLLKQNSNIKKGLQGLIPVALKEERGFKNESIGNRKYILTSPSQYIIGPPYLLTFLSNVSEKYRRDS